MGTAVNGASWYFGLRLRRAMMHRITMTAMSTTATDTETARAVTALALSAGPGGGAVVVLDVRVLVCGGVRVVIRRKTNMSLCCFTMHHRLHEHN